MAAAISDWKNMGRLLTLVAVTASLMFIGVYAVLHYLKAESIEISDTGATLHLGGKNITVVEVHAYQLAVASGVILTKGRKITLRASGLVSTCTKPPLDDFMAAMDANDLQRVTHALLEIFYAQTYHIEWRNPDGTYYYKSGPYAPWAVACAKSQCDRHKVCPDAEYGYLLAFCVPPGNSKHPEEILVDPKTIFMKIGYGATLGYKTDRFVGPYNISFGQNYIGSEIYFTINDTLVRTQKDLYWSDDCEDEANKKDPIGNRLHHILAQKDEKRCAEMKDPQHPYGIWYLDNRGSFTVTLVQE